MWYSKSPILCPSFALTTPHNTNSTYALSGACQMSFASSMRAACGSCALFDSRGTFCLSVAGPSSHPPYDELAVLITWLTGDLQPFTPRVPNRVSRQLYDSQSRACNVQRHYIPCQSILQNTHFLSYDQSAPLTVLPSTLHSFICVPHP